MLKLVACNMHSFSFTILRIFIVFYLFHGFFFSFSLAKFRSFTSSFIHIRIDSILRETEIVIGFYLILIRIRPIPGWGYCIAAHCAPTYTKDSNVSLGYRTLVVRVQLSKLQKILVHLPDEPFQPQVYIYLYMYRYA